MCYGFGNTPVAEFIMYFKIFSLLVSVNIDLSTCERKLHALQRVFGLGSMSPFLQWFAKVADIQLLRQLFAQDTPTTIASWCSLMKLDAVGVESYDAVAPIWFEIGLTACEGRLIKNNANHCYAILKQMSPARAWDIWERISLHGQKVFGGQWPRYESQVLESLMCKSISNPGLLQDMIDSSESLPKTISLHNLSAHDVAKYNMDCIKKLVEAGVNFDLGSVGSHNNLFSFLPHTWHRTSTKSWLAQLDHISELVDLCTGRPKECVTVFGVCAAASRGLDCLREYVRSKPHPVPLTNACSKSPTKNELLQSALSDTTWMGDRRIVRVLLQYGVDVEAKDVVGMLYRRPAVEAIIAEDTDMIALLAMFGADFNGQDILDAVMDHRSKGLGSVDSVDNCGALVDLTVQAGLSLQQYGSTTMLRAVGLLGSNYGAPDEVLIEVLQKRGVTWDESFFNNWRHWKGWGWSDEEVRGMDLLHAAVRKQCDIKTIQYLLNNGIHWHSRLCELDGKSILHAAFSVRSSKRSALIWTLLDRLAADKVRDPAWPRLLELSILGGSYDSKSQLDLFHYLKGLGAPLPLPMNPEKAQQRFSLIPKLLSADAQDEIVREVWNHGEGFEQLHKKDQDQFLLQTINEGEFMWARTIIDHGANVNGEVRLLDDFDDYGLITPVQLACMCGYCPLEFIQYLLEHGGNTTFSGNTGLTALHCAALGGELNLASLLLEKNADVNALWAPDDSQKKTYCFCKLTTPNFQQDEEQDEEQDGEQDEDPVAWIRPIFTPLDLASAVGRLDMVKFLLDIGGRSAFPGLTGFDGALKLAQEEYHPGIVLVFKATNSGRI